MRFWKPPPVMGVSASSEVPPPDEDGFETVRTPSSSGSVATIVPDIEINGIPIKMDIKELDNQGFVSRWSDSSSDIGSQGMNNANNNSDADTGSQVTSNGLKEVEASRLNEPRQNHFNRHGTADHLHQLTPGQVHLRDCAGCLLCIDALGQRLTPNVVDRNIVGERHQVLHRLMGPGGRSENGGLNRRAASPRFSPPFGRRGSGSASRSGPSSRRSRPNYGQNPAETESLRVTVDIRPCANCLLRETGHFKGNSGGSVFTTAVVPAATGIVGFAMGITAGLLLAWLLWEEIQLVRYARVLR